MAGFFIVEDEDELRLREALDLKLGESDIPLVIQDKKFDGDGNLIYVSSEIEQFMGFLGEAILVNLTPNPYLEVGTRVYRFRLLNGSTSRIYRLAFVKGSGRLSMQLIETDGNLLAQPQEVEELFMAPGEKLDVLLDLRNIQVGEAVFLKSLAFEPWQKEMEAGGKPPARLAGGEEFNILKLVVKNRVSYDRQVPQNLSTIAPIDTSNASTRNIVLFTANKQWVINGKTFNMDEHPIVVKRNATEIWKMTNQPNMPHPMHIHGFHFQVLERSRTPAQIKSLAVDDKGRLPTDMGWKDTVLVWPGETVSIAINFSHDFPEEQVYLFHCHILEHEDTGMMVNYKVV